MKILQKTDEILLKVIQSLCTLLLGVMVILILLEILFRYFLNVPAAWAEEFARLATVWCAVLTSAAGIRLMEHPHLEILYKRFPTGVQKILTILIYTAIAVFGVVLAVFGYRFTKATAIDFMTSLGYHKNYFYAPACVGGVLYTIYSIREIVLTIQSMVGRKAERE